MKQIPLTNGGVAYCDDADFDRLACHRWHWKRGREHWTKYARTSAPGGRHAYMHDMVLGDHGFPMVDHKDNNGLNNCRDNLRPCTNSENQRNQRKSRKPMSSPFKGVSYHKVDRRWQAFIWLDGKNKHIGNFNTAVEAAVEYDCWARVHYGAFAKLNFAPAPGDPGRHRLTLPSGRQSLLFAV